jgi:hypothetical protein
VDASIHGAAMHLPSSASGIVAAIERAVKNALQDNHLVSGVTDAFDYVVNHYRDILWRGIQAAISDHIAQVSEHVLWYVFSATNRLLKSTHRGLFMAVVFLLALRSLKGPRPPSHANQHGFAPVLYHAPPPYPAGGQQPMYGSYMGYPMGQAQQGQGQGHPMGMGMGMGPSYANSHGYGRPYVYNRYLSLPPPYAPNTSSM